MRGLNYGGPLRVIDSMVMHSGWHYEQPLESGQRQRIEGRTYRELVQRVNLFRLQHLDLIETGTATPDRVEADITFWVCSRWPHQCTGSKHELLQAPAPTQSYYLRPINRIEYWFKLLAGRQLEFVDAATATRRAEICVRCPLNQAWEVGGCGGCNQNIRRKTLLYRGAHQSGLESKLRGCLAYGWLNELAVWLEPEQIEAKRNPPEACWAKECHANAAVLHP